MDIKLKGAKLSRIKTAALLYLKAFAVFISTFAVLFLLYQGVTRYNRYREWKDAVKSIPDKKIRKLETVREQFSYQQVIQSWDIPPTEKLLRPISWLIFTENCILSGRINAMKFAGMIPGNWTVEDIKKKLKGYDYVSQWTLHLSKNYLSDKILDDINQRLTGNTTKKYRWVSIKNMDELIYLAKRGHHVFIYTQVWLGPSRRYPKPVKYLGKNFSHACTITGIKSYDAEKDIVEFEVNETLPVTSLTYTPVYSRLTRDGTNLFDRQSIPYIIPSGKLARSGYIIRIDDQEKTDRPSEKMVK